ncbi:MAG: hypothetical protein KGO81_01235 [Bacteroidota bacterium]|nr:hypothetical protein [Bacteroidota bacterium]
MTDPSNLDLDKLGIQIQPTKNTLLKLVIVGVAMALIGGTLLFISKKQTKSNA